MATVRQITPTVHQVFVLGVAVTVIATPEETVLIDAGMRTSPARVLALLDSFEHSRRVSHILMTHTHPDHAWGLAQLREATGGLVAVHYDEAAILEGAAPWPSPFSLPFVRDVNMPGALSPAPVPVDLRLRHGDLLDALGGVEVIHTPGHSPGSVCYFFQRAKLLYVGDALQAPGGRLTRPSRMFTRDMDLADRSIRRLADVEPDIIAFSHFPPIARAAAATLRRFATAA
jgi:glyoxylase-like metal-dependent hydrolase (beta-lactamase superfamily II)